MVLFLFLFCQQFCKYWENVKKKSNSSSFAVFEDTQETAPLLKPLKRKRDSSFLFANPYFIILTVLIKGSRENYIWWLKIFSKTNNIYLNKKKKNKFSSQSIYFLLLSCSASLITCLQWTLDNGPHGKEFRALSGTWALDTVFSSKDNDSEYWIVANLQTSIIIHKKKIKQWYFEGFSGIYFKL